MQNMQVFLYPKQIHIMTHPSMSIRLSYKKMAITTNHELQKYQNKEFYPVKNGIATINDEVKFKMSKQFEFQNTKIVIIVIGTKGREVSCLGDICLDLASIKQKKSKDYELCMAKIEKCKDSKAFIIFDIRFIEKQIDLNEMKRIKKQKISETGSTGILKTDHYYKEQLYISRREKVDKPTAYQISRKNYKNNEILRNNQKTVSKEKRTSKDSAKQNTNNGSYKKRFLYEVQRNDKHSQKSSSKQIPHNYTSVYQKDKSPSPRIKTPQPITLETLKSRQTHNRIKSKVQPLNLSQFDSKKVHFDDSNELIEPDTFRAHGVIKQRGAREQQKRRQNNNELSDSNISSNSLQQIRNQKDNKYKMITQKLELIESKIRKRSKSKDEDEENNTELNRNNGKHKMSKSQIDQMNSYSIVNEYQVSRTLTVVSNPDHPNGEHKSRMNYSKQSLSPMSPTESTCPQNQMPPSPIRVVQTPTVNKPSLDEIKMSQFTINSKRSQPSEAQIEKFIKKGQVQKSSTVNPRSLNQIHLKESNENQRQDNQAMLNQMGINRRQSSRSPEQKGKREVSPSSLSFERRESEIKLQKKSSMGQNYLQIQVKMLELQIQEKDMKLQKLDKKLNKKQEQCSKLSQEIQQGHKKVNQLSNQLIQLKTINLNLQKKVQDQQETKRVLQQKYKQLATKQQQIRRLHLEIQSISSAKDLKQACIECTTNKNKNKNSQQLKQEQLRTLQQLINSNNQINSDLNSQLQTYQHQVTTLRQRLNDSQYLKTKYQNLLKTHDLNLSTIATLQQQVQQHQQQVQQHQQQVQQHQRQVQQYQAQKPSSNNSSLSESMIESKQSKISQTNQLTQEVLKQTIEKQTLLQQSLKSLQNRNKSLSQQLQTLQKEKQQLLTKLSQTNQHISQKDKLLSQKDQLLSQKDKLLSQKNQLVSQKDQLLSQKNQLVSQKNQLLSQKDKLLSQKDQLLSQKDKLKTQISNLQIKLKQMQTKLKVIELEKTSFAEQMQKKQKIIQKLSSVNQALNTKLFDLQNQQQPKKQDLNKLHEIDEQIQILLIKNVQYEQTINELNEKLNSKQKQMKILKNLLRQKQNQSTKLTNNQPKKQPMRRQLPQQSQFFSQKQHWKHQHQSTSKSQQLNKIKVTQQGKENYYDHYLNEKAKCVNLQAQLRYAQNQIRNHKMRIQVLVQQKNALEQQIEKAAFGNEKNGNEKNGNEKNGTQKNKTKNKPDRKASPQSQNIAPSQTIAPSVKMQTKQVQQEIQRLQSQVRQLNALLDQIIQKSSLLDQTQVYSPESIQNAVQNGISPEKYLMLVRRLEAYEMELRSKKNKMAEIVNSIWRGGNAGLIDEIDRIMSVQ